jgi:hypothetical protein
MQEYPLVACLDVSKNVPLSRWPPPCVYAHAQIHMLRTSRMFISIYQTITRQWGPAASLLVELGAFLYTHNTSKLSTQRARQAGDALAETITRPYGGRGGSSKSTSSTFVYKHTTPLAIRNLAGGSSRQASRIRQHTSAFVRIRPHMSAYVNLLSGRLRQAGRRCAS